MESPCASVGAVPSPSISSFSSSASSSSFHPVGEDNQHVDWPPRPEEPNFARLYDSLRRLALVAPSPASSTSSSSSVHRTQKSKATSSTSTSKDSSETTNGEEIEGAKEETEKEEKEEIEKEEEWAGEEGRHPMERTYRGLARTERSYLHELAKAIGFVHFSEGNRRTRTLHVLRNPRPLPLARFDPDAQTWTTVDMDPHSESSTTPAGQLRIVTFNVLTDMSPSYAIDDLILSYLRWPAILKILEDTDADGLQEVSPTFHKLLLAEPWVQKNYFISDPFGKTLQPMGNFLMSKIPLRRAEERSYTSQDHGIVKSAIVAEAMVSQRKIAFAVVHLKAGTLFADRRKSELEETIKMLSELSVDDRIILGDFNMRDVAKERNSELERHYVDLWDVIHGSTSIPGQEAYTFDLQKNLMSKAISQRVSTLKQSESHSSRFDRIELSSRLPVVARDGTAEGSHWVVEAMNMIGDERICETESGNEIWPSDHFGLSLVLRFVNR